MKTIKEIVLVVAIFLILVVITLFLESQETPSEENHSLSPGINFFDDGSPSLNQKGPLDF